MCEQSENCGTSDNNYPFAAALAFLATVSRRALSANLLIAQEGDKCTPVTCPTTSPYTPCSTAVPCNPGTCTMDHSPATDIFNEKGFQTIGVCDEPQPQDVGGLHKHCYSLAELHQIGENFQSKTYVDCSAMASGTPAPVGISTYYKQCSDGVDGGEYKACCKYSLFQNVGQFRRIRGHAN